jgi:hypothetical protein
MKYMTLTVSPEESIKRGPSVRLVVTVPVILIQPLHLRLLKRRPFVRVFSQPDW